ncbi:MAG: GPW/gp25 family protein [Marinovum sp.]|nr:GPW/gp25 family protein [Marinovum sp.]
MQDKDTIPYQHWSLKVGRADPRSREVPPFWGEIAAAVDDLHQAISNLLMTPKGSVPTEPELGCDILPYIDRSAEEAVPGITQAIWDAITIWEPRVLLQDVDVSEVEFAHFAARIFWRPTQAVMDDVLLTEVALKATRQVAQ